MNESIFKRFLLADTATVDIVDVDGAPTEIKIELRGTDSVEWARSGSELVEAVRNGTADNFDFVKAFSELDEKTRARLASERYAKITISWTGVYGDDGEELALTYDNAVSVYTEVGHVATQVDAFLRKRANFLLSKQRG